jgi:hypothetical protein
MKLLRRAREAEVIAEFLKNEFYQQEFHYDRDRFRELVSAGNTANTRENVLRRALLFRRRGPMWRELPPDTQWWEVQLEAEDLQRLYVFPRSHWRKVANGSFLLPRIVERIREHPARNEDPELLTEPARIPRNLREFVSKIHALSKSYGSRPAKSAILLIGTSEREPCLIFEGNHRFTAAMLASPEAYQDWFRVYLGFSPNMVRCCWYQTRVSNLLRYTVNRILHMGYDREADVERALHQFEKQEDHDLRDAVAAASEALPGTKGAPTSFS